MTGNWPNQGSATPTAGTSTGGTQTSAGQPVNPITQSQSPSGDDVGCTPMSGPSDTMACGVAN